MKEELIRINSIDGVEQPGILYTPNNNTDRVVVHVHGLSGNFYENRFLDILAKTYTDKNYAFLTFSNRGRGFINELLKGNNCLVMGGCLERFKDCVLDIEGVINWVKNKGYKYIMLEGHSYGCNKVIYYYNHKKDNNIKKIILLAPCDIPSECKKFLSEEEYENAKNESTRLVNEGKEKELIDFSVMGNGKIAAGTYYYDFLPGGENDFLKYVDGINGKSEELNNINIPTLVIFGDNDECVLTSPIEIVEGYLKNNLVNCNIQIIKGANHLFNEKCKELGKVIKENID